MRAFFACLLLAGCLACAACAGGNSNGGPAAGSQATGASPAPVGEVEFAREAFRRLVSGEAAAEEVFDWENLKTLGDDFGAEYRKEADDASKAEARKLFIEEFSASFKSNGGSPESFINWREESRQGDRTIVAADGAEGAKLLVTVARAGDRRKVVELSALEQVGS